MTWDYPSRPNLITWVLKSRKKESSLPSYSHGATGVAAVTTEGWSKRGTPLPLNTGDEAGGGVGGGGREPGSGQPPDGWERQGAGSPREPPPGSYRKAHCPAGRPLDIRLPSVSTVADPPRAELGLTVCVVMATIGSREASPKLGTSGPAPSCPSTDHFNSR